MVGPLMARRRKRALAGINLLELMPRAVAEWTEEDGIVVVARREPKSRWREPLSWLGYKMSVKRVRLDEVGSFAWKLLDGRRTVADVAEALRQEFGDAIEPVEERFGQMVRTLHEGGLIQYAEGEGKSPSPTTHFDEAR